MSQDRSTNAHPAILLMGLPSSTLPKELSEKIAAGLKALEEKATAAGVKYTFLGVTQDDWKEKLVDLLKANKFDGVMIGNGVRSNMPMTHWLEQLIDVIHTNSPQSVVLFNTSPLDSLESIKRWFPAISYKSGDVPSEVVSLSS